MSGIHQPSDYGHVLNIHGPNLFALVYRVDMVNLHTYVTGRMYARETVNLNSGDFVEHPFLSRFERKVHLAVGQKPQRIETGLQILLRIRQNVVHIGSERRRIESRDEYRFRSVVRRGYDTVGTLDDARPEAGTEQQLFKLLTRSLGDRFDIELLVLLLGIGSHGNEKHLSLLATHDCRHSAAYRRAEKNLLAVLVEEQRSSGLDLISLSDQQLGRHAFEVGRRDRITFSRRSDCRLKRSLTKEIDVETFLQFNDIRHLSFELFVNCYYSWIPNLVPMPKQPQMYAKYFEIPCASCKMSLFFSHWRQGSIGPDFKR